MSVLLLCQGDHEAKNRLRNAIHARYGNYPRAIDAIRLNFKGRMQLHINNYPMRVPAMAQLNFKLPIQSRWNIVAKPEHLPLQRTTEALNARIYQRETTSGEFIQSQDVKYLTSARIRLWQMASILLTPLSHPDVEVSAFGTNGIEATYTKYHTSTRLHLTDRYMINYAEVTCLNPDLHQMQTLYLKLSSKLTAINGLLLPEKITAYWDKQFYYEMSAEQVDMHPDLRDEHFLLRKPVTGGVGD